jgi:hypothetical protein
VKDVGIEMLQMSEMQQKNGSQTLIKTQTFAFLECFFGLTKTQLDQFPSIQAYCQHVEKQFLPLLGPSYATLWSSLDPTPPTEIEDCWRLLNVVATAVKSADKDASIQDLWRLNSPTGRLSAQSSPADEDPHVLVAVFAALCWLTMLLYPSLTFDPPANPPSLACVFTDYIDGHIQEKQPVREAKRPISRVFCSFRGSIWDDQPTRFVGHADEDDNLHEGSLTFSALHLFGRVTIEWVDTLGQHLKFDPASRRLSLFRFPTFCVLSALRDGTSPVLTT